MYVLIELDASWSGTREQHLQARGKLWASIKGEDGKFKNVSTPYRVGQEDLARRYAKRREDNIAKRAEAPADTSIMTVLRYSDRWLKDRDKRGIRSAASDRQRLTDHALPALGPSS